MDDVRAAHDRIRPVVVRTPLTPSPGLSALVGAEVRLKLETVQPTNSFKVRGAASKLLSLPDEAAARGVVTASTGNHGRALAHVAGEVGVPAAVCVSDHVPPGKVAALEALGCELVVAGGSQTDALVAAERLVRDRGMTLVHPFDDPDVVAGQGTIGVELAEDAPDTRTVLVPLSGGGLAAGVAVAVEDLLADVRVVGVSMERGAAMAASLAADRPVELPEEPSLADSLQGGVGLDNRHTFALVRDLVDEVVLVTEREIWEAMRFALDHHRLVLEGGGAVGIGALLAGRVTDEGPVAVVCSGANVEAVQLAALARGEPAPTA